VARGSPPCPSLEPTPPPRRPSLSQTAARMASRTDEPASAQLRILTAQQKGIMMPV
jgi:hypothetical protein